jgi:sec-independent protein translocase protein TatA
MITPMKLILILLIVLIVFGAGKLPKVMGDIGKGIRSFKAGMEGKDEAAASKAVEKKDDKPSNPA